MEHHHRKGRPSAGLPFLNPANLLATWFGAGLVPVAPGTFGSIAAIPFAWLITLVGGHLSLLASSIALFFVGWWAANRFISLETDSDPAPVVIDEVAGQWLTLSVVPLDPWSYVIAFVLFHIFDVVKPWPISWADKSVKGGLGIMLDDTLAAIYAGTMVFILAEILMDKNVFN